MFLKAPESGIFALLFLHSMASNLLAK